MVPRGVARRSPLAVAVLAVVVLAMVLAVVPTSAQIVVTSTRTYTLSNGDTVTVVTTTVDGAVFSVSYTEVAPSGLVVLDRDIWYYPNGQISRYEEVRTTAGGAYQTTLVRQYDANGVVRDQYVKIVSGGETIAEQFTTYDTEGYLLTSETRILTTLADGTREWVVTVENWSTGTLVSSTTTEYPYGYDFNAPPVAEKPTWPGNGPKGSGAPGQDQSGWRPGNGGNGDGQGDQNHQHYGAPGQNKKAQ